jgi:hypothetical protein
MGPPGAGKKDTVDETISYKGYLIGGPHRPKMNADRPTNVPGAWPEKVSGLAVVAAVQDVGAVARTKSWRCSATQLDLKFAAPGRGRAAHLFS